MACPNLRNVEVAKQFTELKEAIGERMAYFIWDKVGNVKDVDGFNELEAKYGTNKALILASGRVIDSIKSQPTPDDLIEENIIEDNSSEIQSIQSQIDELINKQKEDIKNLQKKNFKLTFVQSKDIVNSSEPVKTKLKQNKIKEEYKELLSLVKCIGL